MLSVRSNSDFYNDFFTCLETPCTIIDHSGSKILWNTDDITEPGSGYFHFPLERDREYFLQLTAEKQVTRFAKGVAKREWIKTRSRNEVLDCTVYALAAFKLLNPNLAQLADELETAPRTVQCTAGRGRALRGGLRYAVDAG